MHSAAYWLQKGVLRHRLYVYISGKLWSSCHHPQFNSPLNPCRPLLAGVFLCHHISGGVDGNAALLGRDLTLNSSVCYSWNQAQPAYVMATKQAEDIASAQG